jgi:hypothetical protein
MRMIRYFAGMVLAAVAFAMVCVIALSAMAVEKVAARPELPSPPRCRDCGGLLTVDERHLGQCKRCRLESISVIRSDPAGDDPESRHECR